MLLCKLIKFMVFDFLCIVFFSEIDINLLLSFNSFKILFEANVIAIIKLKVFDFFYMVVFCLNLILTYF